MFVAAVCVAFAINKRLLNVLIMSPSLWPNVRVKILFALARFEGWNADSRLCTIGSYGKNSKKAALSVG